MRSKRAAPTWCVSSSSSDRRSSSHSARSRRRRSSTPNSRSESCEARCTGTTGSRSSSPTTPPRCSEIQPGSGQRGKMSSSLVEFSMAPGERDPFRERRPPYSEDAEQAVIGAMLIDAEAILRAAEFVDDTMFYREGHRRIFRAMLTITERGEVVDPLTLSEELSRRGELEGSGGKDYIGFLVDAVPTSANVEYHARIVKEKALLRRLIEVSTEIVAEAFRGGNTADELLDIAEAKIFQVAQQRTHEGFSRIKELLWPTMERIEAIHAGGEAITGIASGFADLDDLTSGFQRSDLIIVAARPSMGKTAFTLNIAQHAAIERERKVAFFSLEMSKESLVQRMLTAEARIDAQKLRKGMLRDEELPMLARAAGILSSAPIWIDDTPGITLLEMRSKSRRLKADAGVDMIIVDYLQLMQGHSAAENRQQEVSQISRGLKALAKELNVPVIALSQLSRAPEQRAGDSK